MFSYKIETIYCFYIDFHMYLLRDRETLQLTPDPGAIVTGHDIVKTNCKMITYSKLKVFKY